MPQPPDDFYDNVICGRAQITPVLKNLQHLVISGMVLSLVAGLPPAYASNPNLFVSAENPRFENHFAGSMVVEVVVNDSNLRETGKGRGEPDVTVNGRSLRMAQATDGNWYAYFANADYARAADQKSLDGGVPGEGLDFGVFCGRDTATSVLGVDFSDTDGVSVPSSAGLAGFSNGNSDFSDCTGGITASDGLNNVVRKPKSINADPNIPVGQIGLDSDAWPVIQLYSFNDVTVAYSPGGPAQTVDLDYGEIPNISLKLDRRLYPSNSEVFVTISDAQLNQDPTDRDSWTFAVGDEPAAFYHAFTSTGSNAANGGPGLVDLSSDLDDLGFDENGLFSITTDSIVVLGTNGNQPSAHASDGTGTFPSIVTFVETQPNTGIFETSDGRDDSLVEIIDNVPRGQREIVTYNDDSLSILSGSSTAAILTGGEASISLSAIPVWAPGTKIPVTVFDQDQNVNSGARDGLDLFRSTATIPAMRIGDPITLGSASGVTFHTSSDLSGGTPVPSSIPDVNSARMLIDTASVPDGGFEAVSINLGVPASRLAGLLIEDGGTNWLNYDLRSLSRQLDLDDLSDTGVTLYFGGLSDPSPVDIAGPGDLTGFQGLVQIGDSAVSSILGKSGTVFVVVNFDASSDSASVASVFNEDDQQPIVIDFFSFGLAGGEDVNNSIYRFELEETSDNSGVFEGTLEYALSNQLNIATSDLIKTLRPIGSEVRLVIADRLLGGEGISISYSDIDSAGASTPATAKSSILTHSGTVSTDKTAYSFGRPVTVILNDPDLNLQNDKIDTYPVIDDPDSEHVDAVGSSGGGRLLEIEIKGTKYRRCTINGVEHGGLAATGFVLVETGPSSGIFEGVFKMPSRICNGSGTALVYTSGGGIDVRYFDFRDSSGEQSIVTLSRQTSSLYQTTPQLNAERFDLPKHPRTTEVVLTGSIDGHKRGIPVGVVLQGPDGSERSFSVYPTSSGSYRVVMTLNSDSPTGSYDVHVLYHDEHVASTAFLVSGDRIPQSIRDIVGDWSGDRISDDFFRGGIRDLAEQRLIDPTGRPDKLRADAIPDWVKTASKLWLQDLISENEYLDAIEFLVKKGIIRI